MGNRVIVAMLMIGASASGQQMLRGEIWSEKYPVENVTVANVSLKKYSTTDVSGKFSIVAREQDTLEFSSISMQPKMLVVQPEHFDGKVDIHLEPRSHYIEEVTVQQYKLTGDLVADSKNIKVKLPPAISLGIDLADIQKLQYVDDQQSKVTNIALPMVLVPFAKVDVTEIFRSFGSKKRERDEEAKNLARNGDPFENRLKRKFTDQELIGKFAIREDRVGLFVQYCSARADGNLLLFAPGNELLLTQFLLEAAIAFNGEE